MVWKSNLRLIGYRGTRGLVHVCEYELRLILCIRFDSQRDAREPCTNREDARRCNENSKTNLDREFCFGAEKFNVVLVMFGNAE